MKRFTTRLVPKPRAHPPLRLGGDIGDESESESGVWTPRDRPRSMEESKLLYQGEDGWAMYDWNGNDPMAKDKLTGDASFLVHACPNGDRSVREVYIFPDTHKACWRCQAPLPDGMKALWIMHNGRI